MDEIKKVKVWLCQKYVNVTLILTTIRHHTIRGKPKMGSALASKRSRVQIPVKEQHNVFVHFPTVLALSSLLKIKCFDTIHYFSKINCLPL